MVIKFIYKNFYKLDKVIILKFTKNIFIHIIIK